MSGNTGPLPITGPKFIPPVSLRSLRSRINSLDSRISYQEKNRIPTPQGLHELNNASALQYAQDGATPTFQQEFGGYLPIPNLSTLLFNMPGSLSLAESDPVHARWPCNITGVAADLSVFSSDVSFDLLVNGSVVQSFTLTSAASGFVAVTGSPALRAYLDLVQVETTSVGTGNSGLVVHIELAVDIANLAES